MLGSVEERILNVIDNVKDIFSGAHNIRKDGEKLERSISNNIHIKNKEDKSGIDVIVKPGTKGESVHIPVILTQEGLSDKVYNTFEIGENSEVEVVAGCGIHNPGHSKTQHDGVHEFFVRKGAKLKYSEKHYAEGEGKGKKVFNSKTILHVEEGGKVEMEIIQIKGVDDTERETEIYLQKEASLVITERMMTEGKQKAKSDIQIELKGEDSTAQVISRSVAKDDSNQKFNFNVVGKNKCRAHVQCDSIIMGNSKVESIPAIAAKHNEAELIHEAAIGKIANDQLIKLMSLGLTEKEAEDTILKGFLK
ncbi:SufB/SufD family protein [Clostridium cochlearium]|uniref:SUF system FeS cluster assembly SufBD core domain-containing protein n=1 Tax=Clostridium cochlearium TaxID=1494 RepID=A0ABY0QIB8_CLOCO|nr:SufD family Fe-S cluster assembly protein [Clostridium cochlearium]MBE6063914.1 SufD family Fe-S cluster assembly protein [Clostridium cochlearium]MBU5269127.1 SufD family Fe-S cluster assembly protein [Clostridium cochlearium]MCG4571121.1 SufD family Fe-S cluster assembly protein [Clostridium cochlearium]MCR1971418.1 SufD family Fe-S cluster assembly protein [Clostridium cochlearium]MDU1442358.1 SufD family Fe-S cluster assembly protein [Clostridium cochlearium]